MALTPVSTNSSLDKVYSNKALGCIVNNKRTTFRLFSPRATQVVLTLFDHHDDFSGIEYIMKRDEDGVWEYSLPGKLYGKYYGYRIIGPAGAGEMFDPAILVGDPCSKAVVTKNNYHQPAKTLILDTSFDWGDDRFIAPADHNKLVIYEAHVRDLTAHRSSGAQAKGTYKGLSEKNKTGGLSWLKKLGVNAVELLPIQKFGTIELPYRDNSVTKDGYEVNTWNPYERNHWGYMTSYFFAPETYYACGGTMKRDKYNGMDGGAVRELKNMIKAFHKEGVAVILDVVFNHASQYDYNPFKYIDKMYYFRTDPAGRFINKSGCGNDFATERPMARRMIIDCISYWMKEYHIDGFRFDLAAMIDWETCNAIYAAAKKINPRVIFIAEPWGGGRYQPAGFSYIGWASWNDQFRDAVKGQNPHDGPGFIFGKNQGGNSKTTLMNFIAGSPRENGGQFIKTEHTVNYLESHDDNTLGDFIRIALGDANENTVVADMDKFAKLTPKQLAIHKLAALVLFTAQGPAMIHEGQEFGRGRIIAPTPVPEPNIGKIDANGYNKDDDTNYLNFRHAKKNNALVEYYRGLIKMRKTYSCFSNAPENSLKFIQTEDEFFIAFTLMDIPSGKGAKKAKEFIVLLNGDPQSSQSFPLPKGKWNVIVNRKKVNLSRSPASVSKTVKIPPTSGMVLVK
ncbi:MAG: pullulanase [Bacteroidota bacterium]